jgi:hypothetical protein
MADEIVVVTGATGRKNLVATIVDSDGNVVNLTGGTVKMQGRSSDLPSVTLDVTGTITDPAQGKVTFSAVGNLITQAQLTAAGIASATFRLRIKFTDSTAKVDFGPIFELTWVKEPTVLTP